MVKRLIVIILSGLLIYSLALNFMLCIILMDFHRSYCTGQHTLERWHRVIDSIPVAETSNDTQKGGSDDDQ